MEIKTDIILLGPVKLVAGLLVFNKTDEYFFVLLSLNLNSDFNNHNKT